jgi:hypothetical protein
MLRFDSVYVRGRGVESGQTELGAVLRLNWKDTKDDNVDDVQNENGNKNRKTERLKVRISNLISFGSDKENLLKQDNVVKVWAIKECGVVFRGGAQPGVDVGMTYQVSRLKFRNATPKEGDSGAEGKPTRRKVQITKIMVNPIPSYIDAALNDGDTVDWDEYKVLMQEFVDNGGGLGGPDKNEYVYIEVPKSFQVKFAADVLTGKRAQEIVYTFQNEDVRKLLKGVQDLAAESTDPIPDYDYDAQPLRLDPFQLIVNVNWGIKPQVDILLTGTASAQVPDIINTGQLIDDPDTGTTVPPYPVLLTWNQGAPPGGGAPD